MLRSTLAGLAVGAVFLAGADASAQLLDMDWTERPDAYAPAGLLGDRLPGARALDIQLRMEHHTFRDILIGRDEIAPIRVLQDWDMVPLERSRQRATLEVMFGLTDAFAFGVRAPFVRNSTTFSTLDREALVTNSGIGDVEFHTMAAVHRTWPVRSHLGLGVSIPTGAVDVTGTTPNMPGSSGVLPYDLQPGSGVVAILPSVQVALENRYGTTGIRASGRVHLGENDRDWRPGNSFSGNLFMQSRLNDWLGLSARIAMESSTTIFGLDSSLDPFASPLHFPNATGGTRIEIPVGMNLRFATGGLEGHRLKAEVIVPVHSDLNGPQLRSNWGATLTWGYTLGRPETPPPARVAYVRTTPAPAPAPAAPRTEAQAPLCPAIAAFAAGRSWYEDDLPIRFEERNYSRAGGIVAPDCTRLQQVGVIDEVPIFVIIGSPRPFQELMVPVREGAWQGYRMEIARVRG
ncbi:hypothetical protein BH23GEM11_BH23GEM11_15180 [soil metagenome]